jgi:hypothetical protein
VSEQSISITENNLTGTVPSVTDKPPLRVEIRLIRGKETPGERDGDGAETDNDSAAAKISSRTESDEEDMTVRGARHGKRKTQLRGEQMKSLGVRSEGINLQTKK